MPPILPAHAQREADANIGALHASSTLPSGGSSARNRSTNARCVSSISPQRMSKTGASASSCARSPAAGCEPRRRGQQSAQTHLRGPHYVATASNDSASRIRRVAPPER
jgi:hypothetical protein